MNGFILFWEIDDHSENGGGFEYEDFDTIEEVYKKIEELQKDSRVRFQRVVIKSSVRKIVPVEKVTKWEIK